MSEVFMETHLRQQTDTEQSADDNDNDDPLSNILRLKLKKPQNWKWELTTSCSSSNIAMPRVMLYSNKGDLLADANSQEEQIFKGKSSMDMKIKSKKRKKQKDQPKIIPHNSEVRTFEEFDFLRITEMEDRISPNEEQQKTSIAKRKDTPPSTTSSSGNREKRKLRRTSTTSRDLVHSESILERRSAFKERLSSPEESEGYVRPRYYLQTSRAGTLVIAEDSFNLKQRKPLRRRRVRKSSSIDSLTKEIGSRNEIYGSYSTMRESSKDQGYVLYESSNESDTLPEQPEFQPHDFIST